MANYPTTLKTTEEMVEDIRDGRQIDATADGMARIRKLYNDRRSFTIRHPWMSPALKSTLDAFYAANSAASFYFVNPIDAATYTVAFAAAPAWTKMNGGRFYRATVKLIQVA